MTKWFCVTDQVCKARQKRDWIDLQNLLTERGCVFLGAEDGTCLSTWRRYGTSAR